MRKTTLLAICLLLVCQALSFADVLDLQIKDKEVDAKIQVGGLYSADLKILFETVSGLTANSISINAIQISPLDILARLTDPSLITLPAQLPILISIGPSAGSKLSFTGVTTIEISTSNLVFDPSLRLFTSPSGGAFDDITNFSGVGSYRVHGTSGTFSDFIILTDLRNVTNVIDNKYDKLQQTLTANAALIQPAMLQDLQSKWSASHTAYQSNDKAQAATILNAMIDEIKNDNGVAIPNIYKANDPSKKNVAGELRRRADTLIFSLKL